MKTLTKIASTVALCGLLVSLFALCVHKTQAQSTPSPSATLTSSVVLQHYQRLKRDLEEKARNIKDMRAISPAELELMEVSYMQVRRQFNDFIAGYSTLVRESKSKKASIELDRLDQAKLTELRQIFRTYEDVFVAQYERIVGQSTRPVLSTQSLEPATQPTAQSPRVVRAGEVAIEDLEAALTVDSWRKL